MFRAVNEEMKRAATYAIAALAKRPVMKRRTPSIGDLLHMAAEAADKQSATAVAAATSSTLSTDVSSDCAAPGTANGSTADNSSVCKSNNTGHPCRSPSPSRNRQGKPLHCRRRSYGENAYYQACGEGDTAANVPVFGRGYIIPKPFDERLLPEVAGAVVEAAIATGVARLADIDLVTYKRELADLSIRTSM